MAQPSTSDVPAAAAALAPIAGRSDRGDPNLDRLIAAQRASRAPARTAGTSTKPRPKPVSKPATAAKTAKSRADKVIAYARKQIGDPYRWGAAGPDAYDCSGLVVAAYASIGIRLPHQTGDLVGKGRRVSRDQMQPGDLVFLSDHHVGIYIGGGKMIHAPHPGDHVRVAAVYAFYTARRLL